VIATYIPHIKHIQFRFKNGKWGAIVRENLEILIGYIKKGEVDRILAATMEDEDVEILKNKGIRVRKKGILLKVC